MQRDFWTKCFHDLTKMMSREAQILQLKWQNFNFGLGSAPDPFTKLMTRPKVLLIGWLRALLWTLANVCSRILDSLQLLVSTRLKFSCTWAAHF